MQAPETKAAERILRRKDRGVRNLGRDRLLGYIATLKEGGPPRMLMKQT